MIILKEIQIKKKNELIANTLETREIMIKNHHI